MRLIRCDICGNELPEDDRKFIRVQSFGENCIIHEFLDGSNDLCTSCHIVIMENLKKAIPEKLLKQVSIGRSI